MNRSLVLLLSFTAACGGGLTALGPDRSPAQSTGETAGDTPAAGTPSDTTPGDEAPTEDDLGPVIRLTGVDPWYGSDAGGSTVTLQGSGFTDGVEVLIDGQPATVVSVTDTEVEVTVPANPGAEWVPVQVVKGARGDKLDAGFQYWPDATGLTGGFLTLERVRMVGGYWVSPADPVAWASLEFFAPLDIQWRDRFAQAMNSCSNNYLGPDGFMQYTLNTPSITLRSGNASWELTPSDTDPDLFTSAYRPAAQVAATDRWGLAQLTATDFPEITTPETVAGVSTFNVTSPAIDRATMPSVGRSFDVRWSGSGGDYVIILLTHYSYQGVNAVPQQLVSCTVDDTGSFTIPRDAWTRWKIAADDYIEVQVGRVTESTWAMPQDHSGLNGVGAAWVLGAAAMQ